MEVIENKTFVNEVVAVDGKTFKACTFTGATLTYGGGELPSFINCQFSSVSLQFVSAASNTLKFLRGLQRGGFSPAVRNIINGIRAVKV
jgi:hypothetical protein